MRWRADIDIYMRSLMRIMEALPWSPDDRDIGQRLCPCRQATFSLIAGVSQVCYSQPGCTGDVVTAPGPSARDCCAGTDDGQSFSSDGVNCFRTQCIGMYVCCAALHE